jgi:hypothetical protein
MNAIRIACAALFCLSGLNAHAASYINLGGGSYHFERDLGHNEFNPGIGYEQDWNENWSLALGYYKNSLRKPTVYGLASYYHWHWESGWRAGLAGGLLTGYRHDGNEAPRLVPLLAPTLEWRSGPLGLQFFIVPSVKPYVDGAVVMQFKFRVKD